MGLLATADDWRGHVGPIVARLRELRIERGISQGELAKRIPMDRTRFLRLEGGSHFPNTTTLAAWADALGCRIDLIEDASGPPAPNRRCPAA